MPSKTQSASRVTRREFIAAAAAASAPLILPSGVLAQAGRLGANDKLVLGHIGAGGQGTEDLPPAVVMQIEGQAALVALQVLKVGAGAARAQCSVGIERGRRLDLDHVGAPVRELAYRRRPRPDPGQVEHRDVRHGALEEVLPVSLQEIPSRLSRRGLPNGLRLLLLPIIYIYITKQRGNNAGKPKMKLDNL